MALIEKNVLFPFLDDFIFVSQASLPQNPHVLEVPILSLIICPATWERLSWRGIIFVQWKHNFTSFPPFALSGLEVLLGKKMYG